MKVIREYIKTNNPVNIIERPMVIEPNEKQLKKIHVLNEFMASYGVLKLKEENAKIWITSPEKAGKYFISLLTGKVDCECFLVAFLDNKNAIIETKVMSVGGISSATIYPRDILKAAMASDCSSMLLAHNHPGGSTVASPEDINLTQRIEAIFSPLDIKVLDHIIVGGTNYLSMAKEGFMDTWHKAKANYEPISMNKDIEEVEI